MAHPHQGSSQIRDSVAKIRFEDHEMRRKHKMRVLLDFMIENQNEFTLQQQKPLPTLSSPMAQTQTFDFSSEIDANQRKMNQL